MCPTLHPGGPMSQVLELSIPLSEKEYSVGTLHVPPFGFTYMTTERTWGIGMENQPQS